MNGDVTVKNKDGMIVRIPYTTISKIKLNGKPEESTKDVTRQTNKPTQKTPSKPLAPSATPSVKK
jgi:hypothetical protein